MPILAYEVNTQQIHTPVFDGPLELLLYLVRRKGVDIRFVKIAPITDAFLHHLTQMHEMQLDIAGEFLLLASTLCYLKSCELLPGLEAETEEESEEDPIAIRNRLANQLREYERFRSLSSILEQRPQLNQDVFSRPTETVADTTLPSSTHIDIDALELLEIYRSILFKRDAIEPTHDVEKEPFSLRRMGEWVLDQLMEGERSLTECLQHFNHKSEKIICFLTILEMAKHQFLQVAQFTHLSEIHLYPQFSTRPSLNRIFTEKETDPDTLKMEDL